MFETVLHANKLSHTDLKPENILFVNSEFEVIDVIRPGKSKKVNKSTAHRVYYSTHCGSTRLVQRPFAATQPVLALSLVNP